MVCEWKYTRYVQFFPNESKDDGIVDQGQVV